MANLHLSNEALAADAEARRASAAEARMTLAQVAEELKARLDGALQDADAAKLRVAWPPPATYCGKARSKAGGKCVRYHLVAGQ